MGLLGTKRCPTADKSKEERGVDEIERLQRYHEDRHGRRMTDKELREHLERETGEENRARPGPGRPRTVGLEGTVVPAYLYLTEELLSAIDGVRGGKSRSQWVREAIEEKLARGDEGGRGR